MADPWRDEDWRWREGRDRGFDEGGRRFGEDDYGHRPGRQPDYPYNYFPQDTRFYGAPYGYPGWAPIAPPYAMPYEYRPGLYEPNADYDRWARYGRDRDWLDRASDEVSSWFGDEEAARRREMDQRRGGHYGRGPRGYKRADDRIAEDVNDRLTDDWRLDATDIDVTVKDGEVTLSGAVQGREDKRRAEDLAGSVSGVVDVQNNIRVSRGPAADGAVAQEQADREAGTGSRTH